MNFKEFFSKFPTEESCKEHFKMYRDNVGVVCKKCGCREHYWLSTISYYKCKGCGFRTSLRSGTVMENSKLPFMYWYMSVGFVTSTKKSFSALEVQRQVGHKYYEPVWEMIHKLRCVMGIRESKYVLGNEVEIDEGYFVTTDERDKSGMSKRRLKPGHGSPRTSTVLVMTESIPNPKNKNKNKHRPNRVIGRIKMIRVDDHKLVTVTPEIERSIDSNSKVITDGGNHYNKLGEIFDEHQSVKLTYKPGHTVLPWVHTTISNVKRGIIGTHHSIGKKYCQNYLNEFSFKFNRRYMNVDLFDRLMTTCVSYHWRD